jgi:arylsulfatase A-like enzyme
MRYFPHEDESVRFAEILARAGIPSVAYFTLRELDPERGVTKGMSEATRRPTETLATALVAEAIARIRAADGPLFVYVHVADAHAPYDRGGKDGTDYERYLREVRIIDRAVGQLVAAISEPDFAPRSILFLTADHGEAFGEHNDWNHSHTIYEEQLRVPLFVRAPRVAPRRIDAPVSLIDIGPTMLDLHGLSTPGSFMGQSLVAFLRGHNPKLTRPIVAESLRWTRAMMFPDGWKVIEDRKRGIVEQYDLARDPGELDNVFPDRGPDDMHLGLLRKFFEVHARHDDGYVPPYFFR